MRSRILLALCLVPFIAGISFADTFYQESVDGELSNSFDAPTNIEFMLGSNTVLAEMGNNGQTGGTSGGGPLPIDADYFTFSVGPNQELSSITVDLFDATPPGAGGGSFVAYIAGSSFPGQGGADFDAFAIFDLGTDLTSIFDLPLGPGAYSFWFQETADTIVDYQLTFELTQGAVPEPSGAVLLGLIAIGLSGRRRR